MNFSKSEYIIAKKIKGNTLSDIFHELSELDYDSLRRLMSALKCSLDDLAIRIAKAKGLLCTKKEIAAISKLSRSGLS